MTSPSAPLSPSARRYRSLATLGRGGMAEVFLTVVEGQAGFNKLLVLKKTRPEFSQDEEFVSMFLDEARLAARLNHPNVVQTYEVGQEDGQHFIAMEFLDGQPLNRVRRPRDKERMPLPLHLLVLCDVLEGLHHAHELCDFDGTPLHVVHRDVSPQNVFVTYDGQVKVVDFGIAKAMGATVQTQFGLVKGKVTYMAPEQAMGRAVDRRADIFSVGVLLFEALAGGSMWSGVPQEGISYRLLQGDLPSLRERSPDAPEALVAIVQRALSFDPADRHATAADMAIELDAYLRTLSARPSHRELGRYVSETFASDRAQVKRTIEEQLGGLSRSGPGSQALPRIEPSIVESSRLPAVAKPAGLREAAAVSTSSSPIAAPASVKAQSTPTPGVVYKAPPTLLSEDSSVQNAPRTMPAPTPASAHGGVLRTVGAVAALGVGIGLGMWGVRASGLLGGSAPVASSSTAVTASAGALAKAPPEASSAALVAGAASCPDGMVLVPGGQFFMGYEGKDALDFEKPTHPVKLGSFCIDVTEVTVEQYRACSDEGKCKRASTAVEWPDITAAERKLYSSLCNVNDPTRTRHPINCVDWEMADTYCQAQQKRLPTSAEWEFAVRGPDGRTYPWGDEMPDASRLNACGKECMLWGRQHRTPMTQLHAEDDGYPTTAPVGSFPKGRSRYGLDDAIGNVMEWVHDWDGAYTKAASTDPQGPATGTERVIRGGAWNAGSMVWVRPSFRYKMAPAAFSHGIGMRCARSAG